MLLIIGAVCVFLFAVLHFTVSSALQYYFETSSFQERATEKHISEFQSYVRNNQIAVSDTEKLTEWVRRKPMLLLEIYRSNVLLYTSTAPYSEEVSENSEETPYYSWRYYYIVEFEDGEAEILLYSDDTYQFYTAATVAEIVICCVIFLLLFSKSCRKSIRYISQLSHEIQAMESGDLDFPVTIRGNNELTTLAECLDAMRLAFRKQQEQEAEYFAANQALITEMSHDLRTPLTTLRIYTDVLRYQKYQDEEQLQSYLEKIDAKAEQIKQLSENILAYSLIAQERSVELEPPALFQCVFEELLAEAVITIEQYGYVCKLEIAWEPVLLSVRMQYMRRIMDNIVSNILKYASMAEPVEIRTVYNQEQAGLIFANRTRLDAEEKESTRIGLSSIGTMMKKMNAVFFTEKQNDRWEISLLFPIDSTENIETKEQEKQQD